jgi:hypothetical protein
MSFLTRVQKLLFRMFKIKNLLKLDYDLVIVDYLIIVLKFNRLRILLLFFYFQYYLEEETEFKLIAHFTSDA